jgi:hypothetical protein
MARYHNPKITTNKNLSLVLDAANPKSYTGVTTSVTTTIEDPYADNVSLLLNGNGTNGSTTFTDSSSYGHTVTANGNAQISTTQSKFGGASMYFDGSGDYLEVPPSAGFDFDYGPFTVEAWIYLTANGTTAAGETYWPIVNKHSIYNTTTSTGNNTAWDFRYGPQVGNKLVFVNRIQASNFTQGVNVFTKYSTAVNLSLNTWYHVAAVRDGTTLKLFLNGQDVTDTNTGNYDWSTINMSLDTGSIGQNKVRVGRMLGGSNPGTVVWYAVGYIDDLRITKGIARYTSNLTPPTAQLPGAETGTFASGLWTGLEQCDAIRREIWPGFVPPIVTDGLVLHLDAGDSASYPGSGTTWTDLSGNGNNGTLVSMDGNNYSSANGGYLDFDGSSDYVQGTISSSTFTGPHSICCWFYRQTVKQWAALFSNNVNTTSCSILTFIDTSNSLGTNQSGINATSIAVDLGADHLNKWIYGVITFGGVSNGSAVNLYAYKDGSLLTNSGSLYWNMSSSSSYYVGRHWASAFQVHDGFISQVTIYNKALTQSEITQNYNALKGRYGL